MTIFGYITITLTLVGFIWIVSGKEGKKEEGGEKMGQMMENIEDMAAQNPVPEETEERKEVRKVPLFTNLLCPLCNIINKECKCNVSLGVKYNKLLELAGMEHEEYKR